MFFRICTELTDYTEILKRKKVGTRYFYLVENLNGQKEWMTKSWVLNNSEFIVNLLITKDGKLRANRNCANSIWNYWTYFQGEQTQGKMTISKVLREYGVENLKYLKEKGYDGIIIKNAPVGIKDKRIINREIIVFNPFQIKSIYNYKPKRTDSLYDGFKDNRDGYLITEEQLDYFKNTKIKGKNGKPIVCYHATNEIFDSFDLTHVGEGGGSSYGDGFYFSTEPIEEYGKVMEVFLDIHKPYEINNVNDFKEVLQFLLICLGNNMKE